MRMKVYRATIEIAVARHEALMHVLQELEARIRDVMRNNDLVTCGITIEVEEKGIVADE
jgi:hypothetical protein